MRLSPTTKQILREHKQDIIDKNYQEFFYHLDKKQSRIITKVLYDAHVDFLSYMDEIPIGMFNETEYLTELDIPNNIHSIRSYAFKECFLTEVSLPANIKQEDIGAYVFQNCYYLSKVTFKGNGLTAIPIGMFNGCSNLKHIDLPNKLQFIGISAFRYSGITEITLPETLLAISDYAFSPLKKIHFMGSKEQWDKVSKGEETGIEEAIITFEK